MNIEERFLQKAIQDRNYISFIYKEKTYKKVLPLKLENKENKYLLLTKENTFDFTLIKKLQILKQRF